MKEYHKIETLFERDEKTKKLIEGKFRNQTIEFLKDNVWTFTEKVDGCVHSKTLINMADGSTKRISQIKEGELVWGYDTITNQPKIVPVIATRHQSRAGQWVKIKTTRYGLNKGNFFGTIHCTHDHKVWTKNRGYVEACQLTKEDILLSIRRDIKLTPIQEQVLVGKMLGDGHISIKENEFQNTAHIDWGQIEKEYTDFTSSALQGLGISNQEATTGYGSHIFRARTMNSIEIYNKFNSWLISGHKEVPEDVVLTPISIAFWYMDDGSLAHTTGQEDRVRFSTNGFNEKSCEYLLRELKKFNIIGNIKNYKGNTICLNADNAEKLFLLISPYICSVKRYKLPERYRDYPCCLPTDVIQPYQEIIKEQHIVDIEIDTKPRERWDIQTETENFFTVGGLVHNTNIRINWDGHKVEFGGRTDKAQIPNHLLERLNQLFGGNVNEELFEQKFADNEVILFGEGYGVKIQNGGLYRDDVDFILFDVMINGNYQTRESVEDIAKYFNLDVVPIVLEGTLQDGVDYVKNNRKSIVAKNGAEIEGLVGRTKIETFDRTGHRNIVKIKYCDFN